MLFNSPQFILFFIVTVTLFYLGPHVLKWGVLILASAFFYYQWQPWFVLILAGVVLSTWAISLLMSLQNDPKVKKFYLAASIFINLGLLLGFKYTNFAISSVNIALERSVFDYSFDPVNLMLPIGLSFYSLAAIGYSFDVYRENIKPERHLGHFALFMSFFPKLISGPIERGVSFLPQLKEKIHLDPEKFSVGFHLFVWGIFKKVVIADRLKLYVDMVYGNPYDYSGKSLILATWFFTVQIYCDFSAYTDMARGCGKMLGFDLSENFNFPYFARSIHDFWKRWHITLTSWFRDYLYIPLGGNRAAYLRWMINIMIVFLVSGLWHGASWTFVVWGGLHGFFYLTEQVGKPLFQKALGAFSIPDLLLRPVQIFITFNLVAFAWIFFRADSFEKAFHIATHLFSDMGAPLQMGSSVFTTIITLALLACFTVLETGRLLMMNQKTGFTMRIPYPVKSVWMVGILITTFLFGAASSQFIYFHF